VRTKHNILKRLLLEEDDLSLNAARQAKTSLYARTAELGDEEHPEITKLPLEEDMKVLALSDVDLSNIDHKTEKTGPLHDPEHEAGRMAKQNLFLIGEMASRLAELVQESDELAPWMEQKITTALNEIEAVFRHAEYKVAQKKGQVSHSEDLEEDLSIEPSGDQIKESLENNYDSPDLLLLEEASDVLANAENEITNLAKIAQLDGNRMLLAKTSRTLRDIKTDIRARVSVEKMKMRTRG
jgi:hypothetical protein